MTRNATTSSIQLKTFEQQDRNFFVIDEGKTSGQKSLVLVENGKYKGFGYADLEGDNTNLELLKENIQPYNDNRDIQQIIKSYLRKNKVEKVIRF